MPLSRVTHYRLGFRLGRHVGLDKFHREALGPQQLVRRGPAFAHGPGHIGDHHRGALLREQPGNGAADTRGAACDDGDLAREPLHAPIPRHSR